MDASRRYLCLLIFLDIIKVVTCDGYSIAGLVTASAFAGVLFVVILAIAALTYSWKDASYQYLTSRGKVKIPRSWVEQARHSHRKRAKAQKAIEIRLMAQYRRPNISNNNSGHQQNQGAAVNMDPGSPGPQINRVDIHDNRSYTGLPTSPIVTEVESERGGSRYIQASSSSRYSNYSNSNLAHFGNAAIQNHKINVSTQSINLSDDDVLDSASRATTLEHGKKDQTTVSLDNFTDNTAKFQRRHLYNGPIHNRYSSVDSEPGVV